jgi:hypothetical protein
VKPFILTNLDDCLFGTQRKVPEDQREGLILASRLVDGSPSGFFTRRQKHMLESLFGLGTVIPVTARSLDAFRRVDIDWRAEVVCAHGGLIVGADGQVDRDWLAQVRAVQAASALDVASAFDLLEAEIGDASGYRRWIVDEPIEGGPPLTLYIVVKHEAREEAALAPLGEAMRAKLGSDWAIHLNGNNLAIMPRWLGKRAAVQFLLRRIRADHPHAPVIGMGDSHSDIGFLAECDYMMTPSRGQIAESIRQIDLHAAA